MDNHANLLAPPIIGGTATPNRLAVEVSYFAHKGDKYPTRRQLTELLQDANWADEVNRIREILVTQGQKAYSVEKVKQPCFLISVLCEGGHSENCVVRHTGLLAFDIDSKDNPEWTTDEIKDCLRQYTNIAYCGVSLSGEGVWGIVPIAYPDRHAQHFRALTRIFQHIGEKHKGIPLVIDQSCSNVNRLRFHSYDPDPVYRMNPTVFTACREEVKPTIAPANSYKGTFKPLTVGDPLRVCVRMVEGSMDGEKHTQLRNASRLAGGYIIGGAIGEETAYAALEYAISQKPNVHDFAAAQRTIRAGIAYGKLHPISEQQTVRLQPQRLITKSVVKAQRVAATIAEQADQPGAILRPDESQIERLEVAPSNSYPTEWDEPNLPGAMPTIKEIPLTSATAFHEWQSTPNSPFYGMGLASPTNQ